MKNDHVLGPLTGRQINNLFTSNINKINAVACQLLQLLYLPLKMMEMPF